MVGAAPFAAAVVAAVMWLDRLAAALIPILEESLPAARAAELARHLAGRA